MTFDEGGLEKGSPESCQTPTNDFLVSCVDTVFGDPETIMLVGSRAVGLGRAHSDYDLFAFLPNEESHHLPLKYRFGKNIVEVKYLSPTSLYKEFSQILSSSKTYRNDATYSKLKTLGELSSRIITGTILKTKSDNKIKNFKDLATEVCNRYLKDARRWRETNISIINRRDDIAREVWTTNELRFIQFEYRCFIVKYILYYYYNEKYIGGRYQWIINQARRVKFGEAKAYLSSAFESAEAERVSWILSELDRHEPEDHKRKSASISALQIRPSYQVTGVDQSDAGSTRLSLRGGRKVRLDKETSRILRAGEVGLDDEKGLKSVFKLMREGLLWVD